MKSRSVGSSLVLASTVLLAVGASRPAEATGFSLDEVYQWGLAAGNGAQSSGIQGTNPAPILSLDLPTISKTEADTMGDSASLSMYGSATPGQLHAFGYTTAMWNGSAPPLDAASSFVELSFQWSDSLTFQSTSLAFGAPVSYTLEYVLDSTLNETATLCAGRPVGDAAPAPSIVLTGVGNTTELIRSPCGLPGSGSDHMVATVTFMSTVGGSPLIQEGLSIAGSTAAGGGNPDLAESMTVNAADTGSLYVLVNTPNVTFTAASGATYQPTSTAPVPEPTTLTLTALGLAGVVSRYRLRRARR
jgi:hypothetical protein